MFDAPVDAYYAWLLDQHPGVGDLRAVAAGLDHFGRGFDAPTIGELREALQKARDARGDRP